MNRLASLVRRPDAEQTAEVNALLQRIAHLTEQLRRADVCRRQAEEIAVQGDKDLQVLAAAGDRLEARLNLAQSDLADLQRDLAAGLPVGVSVDQSLRARLARAEANNTHYENRLAAYEGRPSPIACPQPCCVEVTW